MRKVFLFTDASNTGTGAWKRVSTSRDSAQPVAYDSRTFNTAQCNYPIHDRELLAIINALHHWCLLLYGVPVHVYCDHFTLQWFLGQCNLSPHQLRRLSILKDFNLHIEYIKDPSLDEQMATLHALTTYQPTLAPDLLCAIAQGYQGVTVHDHNSYQLLLVDNRLCIPDINNLREDLM